MMARERQALCILAVVVIGLLSFVFYAVRKSPENRTAALLTAPPVEAAESEEAAAPAPTPSAETLGELLAAVSADRDREPATEGARAVGEIQGTGRRVDPLREARIGDQIESRAPEEIPLTRQAPAVAEPQPARPRSTEYVVKKGETLTGISKAHYGTTRKWRGILEANSSKLSRPEDLREGMTIVIPGIEGAAPRAASPSAAPAAPSPSGSVKTHEVAKGETLSGISTKYYGTSRRWKDILKANAGKLARPEDLRPGMKLKIP
jgi:nucleoid-associated protein YgaU